MGVPSVSWRRRSRRRLRTPVASCVFESVGVDGDACTATVCSSRSMVRRLDACLEVVFDQLVFDRHDLLVHS